MTNPRTSGSLLCTNAEPERRQDGEIWLIERAVDHFCGLYSNKEVAMTKIPEAGTSGIRLHWATIVLATLAVLGLTVRG